MTTKSFNAAVGAVLLLSGCAVGDSINNTTHPPHGTIRLTTDWNGTDTAAPPGEGYSVVIGDYSATHTEATRLISRMFEPGDYVVYVHNRAENLHIDGTLISIDEAFPPYGRSGRFIYPWPGVLYASATDVTVEKDFDHEFTSVVGQHIRKLTFCITPEGGTTEQLSLIMGVLSGVAGTLDVKSGVHSSESNVELIFERYYDGIWRAEVYLLGVVGNNQNIDITIDYDNDTPAQEMGQFNVGTLLADFNSDKKTPLTLGNTIETPTEAGFTSTIGAWVTGNVEQVTAD